MIVIPLSTRRFLSKAKPGMRSMDKTLTPMKAAQLQIAQSYRDLGCSHPQLGFPKEEALAGQGLSRVSQQRPDTTGLQRLDDFPKPGRGDCVHISCWLHGCTVHVAREGDDFMR